MPVRVVVKAKRNGPLQLFIDGRLKAVLCRCGHSQRKPYCDGSHARAGFEAEEAELVFEAEG